MADFRSEHELAAYVRKAMTDPQVYQRHLAWKKQPIPPHVEREVQEQMGNRVSPSGKRQSFSVTDLIQVTDNFDDILA